MASEPVGKYLDGVIGLQCVPGGVQDFRGGVPAVDGLVGGVGVIVPDDHFPVSTGQKLLPSQVAGGDPGRTHFVLDHQTHIHNGGDEQTAVNQNELY